MKLPSIWPVLCLAGGILLSGAASTRTFLTPLFCLAAAASLLLAGYLALWKCRLMPAIFLAAAAWICLGAAAAEFEQRSVPGNLASALVDSGRLDSSVPLRWRGRLREDPLQMPWGTRYVIKLDEVESSSEAIPVIGGLSVTFYRNDTNTSAPPAVRAGDRVEVLARGVSPRNFANPGSFDFRRYLALQGIHLQAALRDDRLLTVLGHPRPTISERLARARGRLLRTLDDLFRGRPDQAALARAMLLGDRSFVDHDVAAEFQQTGVYHVLVLAGLHVGALAAFFLWAGRRFHLGLFPRTLLTLAALAAYAGIVEDRPPILRAVLMAAVYLFARLLYRRMDLLNVAALSALVLLVFRPAEIHDASFLLTYSAVAVIGGLAVPWIAGSSQAYLHGLSRVEDVTRDASCPPRVIQFRIDMRAAAAWLAGRLPARAAALTPALVAVPLQTLLYAWELILLSVFLQLGMLPPLAYYFHRVTLAGPLANVPAVFLTGVIVPLGFFTIAISLAWRAPAMFLARLLGFLLAMLNACVKWFARWHWASWRIPGPPLLLVAGFVLAAIAASAAVRSRRRGWGWCGMLALAGLAAVMAADPFPPRLDGNSLEVTVLDVGQGDSLFLAFPGRHTMLVDAGGATGTFHSGGMRSGIDIGEDVVSPYLWSRGLKRIEVVALTHGHQDHLGGLAAVLENFRVGELWIGRDVESASFQRTIALARQRGVRIVRVKQGDSFTRGGVAGTILWPEDTSETETAKNDDSLVIRLTEKSQSILLPGDIERPSEREILAENRPVSATFLKVAHHGSKTSTMETFLSAVHPAFAAISVGKDNSFGHPSPEVLERLEADGVRVYRTDRDGAITVITDGNTLSATTFLHPGTVWRAESNGATTSQNKAAP